VRIGIIVSDFPKVTETFILRDLVHNHHSGHEMRIFHLTPWRKDEVVHGFAQQTLGWATTFPFLFDSRVLGALARALIRHPLTLLVIISTIIREFLTEPANMLKALAIVPKSLAMAENLAAWETHHIHAEFAGHPATAAWIVHRMTGLPFSVSCHAHDIFRTQRLLKQKLTAASFVRCISEFNRNFLRQRFPQLIDHPLPVIHVGVDTQNIQPLLAAHSDTFHILYVGSLQIRKGINFLLQALAQLAGEGAASLPANWRCDIVGDGPEAKNLAALAQKLGLDSQVTFHGAQPFEQVSRFLTHCNLLTVPSIEAAGGRTEGIPTVIMEALAHQRPVIASRLSGIPELIVDGDTGYLITPGDAAGLATAITHVANNPDAAMDTARRGRRRIEQEFDMVTNADARLQLYLQHSA